MREEGGWHSSDPPDSLPSSAKAKKSDETGLQHQATEWGAMWTHASLVRQRVTLSSEGPFLLGLLLEPFKLQQVRRRGSLKARKREDLLTLLAHNAAPFLQRLRTTHGEFSWDLSMRKTGEYKI